MSLAFKVGDSAVYAGYGVGEITAIETREILGNKETFYSVRIKDSATDILVPKNRTHQKGGLRRLVNRGQIEEVMGVLKESDFQLKNMKNWNKKIQEYMKKLKTGSLLDVAYVLKELSLMKMRKNLSFGEKQLLDQAWDLFSKEVLLVLGNIEGKQILNEASQIIFVQKH
ncbi:MAG: CarD family transcriptional regulator [Bdellovibrionales bacterium]|nr:CarD family transcriptional regulator [Bdellovibrionales bacterium]